MTHFNYDQLRLIAENNQPLSVSKWNTLVDQLEQVESTLNRVHLAADGKVGIGMSNPQAKLHILHKNEDALQAGALALGSHNQTNLRFGYDKDYSWIQSGGNKPLVINAAGNNVGVGTNKPLSQLHVKSNGAVFSLEGNRRAYMTFFPRGAENGRKAWLGFGGDPSNVFSIVNEYKDSLILGTNGKVKLLINKDGNIGIGTSEPLRKLHIKSNVAILALEGTNRAYMEFYPKGVDKGRKAWIGFGSSTDNTFYVTNEYNHNLGLRTNNKTRLLINKGKIGIGTSSPKTSLHIKGQLTVENGNGERGWIIMRSTANTNKAKTLLNSLSKNQLIIAGAWHDKIYFYWKDDSGRKRYTTLKGSTM